MIEIKAPNPPMLSRVSVFLAGSIEMDMAERWQERFVNEFQNYDIQFLNPRRDDWDRTIAQRKSDKGFSTQVNWELDCIEMADIVVFYFQPGTGSPVTLLELGYVLGTGSRTIICCPDGFWRKGNIEIMAHRERVTFTETFEDFVEELKEWLDVYLIEN